MKKLLLCLCIYSVFTSLLCANEKTKKNATIWYEKPTAVENYTFKVISGGKGFLLYATDGQYKKALPFQKNSTVQFTFPKDFITVNINDFCELEPVHVIIDISFTQRAKLAGCKIREGEFLSQKALFLENSLVYMVILPELGGRIIDIGLQADKENYMYVNDHLVSSYHYTEGWQDLGGLEDNTGKWCGPFWNKEYSYKILKNTPEKIALLLSTKQYPPIKFEKTITIQKNSCAFDISTKCESRTSKKLVTAGIHPELIVGGGADASDIWFWQQKSGNTVIHSYGGSIQSLPGGAFSGFTGIVDTESLHSIIFAFNTPVNVGLYEGGEYYNLELSNSGNSLKPFNYKIYLFHGVSIPAFFHAGIAGSISTDRHFLKHNETAKITVSLVPASVFDGSISLIDEKAGSIVEKQDLEINPMEIKTIQYAWNSKKLPDGQYTFDVVLKDKKGNTKIRKDFSVEIIAKRFAKMEKQLNKLEGILNTLLKKEKQNRVMVIEAFYYLERARNACEEGKEALFGKKLSKIHTIINTLNR